MIALKGTYAPEKHQNPRMPSIPSISMGKASRFKKINF
jgi:hypothetical protein